VEVIITVGVYVPDAVAGCSIEGAVGFLFPAHEIINTKSINVKSITAIRLINPPEYFL